MRKYSPDKTDPERRETVWNFLFLWFVKLTAAPILFVYFGCPRIIGGEYLRRAQGKTLIISNHISTWDPVLINYACPLKRLHFMAASIMFSYNGLFSWFLNQLGAFSVTREKTDLGALGVAIDILESNKILGIFPEGRRSEDGELLPFRPGAVMVALASGAPIIPVCLFGDYKLMHRMTVVVGEPMLLSDYCSEQHPSPEKLRELCTLLQNTVAELQHQAKIASSKKNTL